MGFETVENLKPVQAGAGVPDDGVLVFCRSMTSKKRPEPARWIAVKIGPALAKSLCLNLAEINLAVMFGDGPDSGKIAISVDATDGGFLAKKASGGGYAFTINSASADGLFSTDFPKFSRPELEVVHHQGKPPMVVFDVSEEMLAVDD